MKIRSCLERAQRVMARFARPVFCYFFPYHVFVVVVVFLQKVDQSNKRAKTKRKEK